MKNKLILITIGVALFLATGCCKRQYPTAGDSVRDSLSIERHTVARDTILTIPGDSVRILIPEVVLLNADSTAFKTIEQTSGRAHLVVSRQRNEAGGHELKIQCDCDSAAIAATLLDTYIKEHRQVDKTQTITSPPERYVPGWVKILAWTGGIFLLLLAVAVFLKIKKYI